MAWTAGVKLCECDVAVTSDGQIVLGAIATHVYIHMHTYAYAYSSAAAIVYSVTMAIVAMAVCTYK